MGDGHAGLSGADDDDVVDGPAVMIDARLDPGAARVSEHVHVVPDALREFVQPLIGHVHGDSCCKAGAADGTDRDDPFAAPLPRF